MQHKQVQGNKATFADEKQEKEKQREAKLAAIIEKRRKGQLTLKDIDDKLDVVLEMLEELLDR